MNNTSKIWREKFGNTPCVGLDHPEFASFMDALTADCLAEDAARLPEENKRLRKILSDTREIASALCPEREDDVLPDLIERIDDALSEQK